MLVKTVAKETLCGYPFGCVRVRAFVDTLVDDEWARVGLIKHPLYNKSIRERKCYMFLGYFGGIFGKQERSVLSGLA